MSHISRYYELKKLSAILGEASKIVEKMAFNVDLPIFDSELENSLRLSYDGFRNQISELNSRLF